MKGKTSALDLVNLALVATLLTTRAAQAQGSLNPAFQTYLSNLGESSAGSALFASDAWLAQAFTTGTNLNGYLLGGPLFFSGTGSPAAEVSFYSDSNGVPGILIGISNTVFTPSTVYWLVATASEPSQSSGGIHVFTQSWNYTSDFNYSSLDNWSLNAIFATSTNGVNWSTATSHGAFQFGISATPVPEPGPLALLGFGPMTLLLTRRLFHPIIREP